MAGNGMTCKNCTRFSTTEHYPEHLGWCDLQLPTWFFKAAGIDSFEVCRTIRVDDACSFFEEA